MYSHYSKVLLARVLNVDPKTHRWTAAERECMSPVVIGDDEKTEARTCFDDLLQWQVDQSIRNLDFDIP